MNWLLAAVAEPAAIALGGLTLTVAANPHQQSTGPDGRIVFVVSPSRPAKIRFVIQGLGLMRVVTDTSGEGRVTFSVPTISGRRVLFRTGDYSIGFLATDLATGDTATLKLMASVVSPEVPATGSVIADDQQLELHRTTFTLTSGGRELAPTALREGRSPDRFALHTRRLGGRSGTTRCRRRQRVDCRRAIRRAAPRSARP